MKGERTNERMNERTYERNKVLLYIVFFFREMSLNSGTLILNQSDVGFHRFP